MDYFRNDNQLGVRPTVLTAAALVALVALVGCRQDERSHAELGAAEVELDTDTSVDEPLEINDASITKAVERELLFDHHTPATDIEARTINGEVELVGRVDNLLAKQRATRIAEQVRGVRAVSNHLELASVEAIDDEALAGDVDDALLFDPAAERYELEVRVEGGVVTLVGIVSSWAERQLAERVASSIRGVREVEAEIWIAPAEQRVDAEILAEVNGRLRWDVLVNYGGIAVEVEGGKVSLSGTVGSVAERRRAYADAWTSGVYDVDVSGLEIAVRADQPDLHHRQLQTASEAEIRAAIVDAASYDPRVFSFEIDPVVEGKSVTLRGSVDNLEAKQAVERIAHHTVGVAHVVNDLEVAPARTIRRRALEQAIEAALRTNVYTHSYEIEVKVLAGVATLTGTVDSYLEMAEAGDVAASARGVVTVTNLLQVEDDGAGFFFDPYLYPYHPYVHPWRTYAPATTALSDEDIAGRVEYELFWSPFVDQRQVEAEVLGGRVTLTGTVDSWRERSAAEQEAFEAGAVSVNNLLHVDL
jgi:osmotically-inducible protein OsmY